MKIHVRVRPASRENSVRQEEGVYVVRTTAVAEKGRANTATRKLLAAHFGVGVSQVQVTRGQRSPVKQVTVTV